MRIARTKRELRAELAAAGDRGPLGLVPTMGYLHDGHLSLAHAARESCSTVVMSLFVNPAQFGPGDDLERYPRDAARDAALAEAAGVDILFIPLADEVYAGDHSTYVEVAGLADVLCGDPARRGAAHFRGVTTVVSKLFNLVNPDLAFFGQKDAQQVIVLKRMVRDLDFPVEIVVLPTIREPDGLAMSSRNAYLDAGERERAPAIYRALEQVRAAAEAGATTTAEALQAARAVLAEAGVEPEYLEARDATTLAPAASFNGRPVLVAVAAPLGGARLIDNVVIEPAPLDRAEATAARSESVTGAVARPGEAHSPNPIPD